MWMVRAGEGAFLIDEFKKRNIAVIGWGIGDVKDLTEEQIKERLRELNPDKPERTIGKWEKIIYDFRSTMEKGDYVLSATKLSKSYMLGVFVSDYYFCEELIKEGVDKNGFYNNFRDVRWICEIPSTKISKETKGTLGQPLTSFKISDNARDELLSLIDIEPPFESNLPRNVVYFGAPGTGKSFNLNKDKDEKFSSGIDYERVTFHPDYSYANFVGTYKPRIIKDECGHKTDDITYEYVPGPFMRSLVKALKNPDKPFLLIIEEINRANVAAVFGDVFQLLDRDEDKNYESKYDIETSEDIKDYLKEELNQVYDKIKIPSNMFIWATMNSADQGVFPMDTAFKRRWEFKYFGIDCNEKLIKHIKVDLNGREIVWNDLRKTINKELLRYGINEDKLIGPFFAFNEYVKKENSESKEITDDKFKKIFKNKIIMYLFEDAARARRNELFDGARVKDENVIYSQICDKFDDDGIGIFHENIIKEII